MTTRRPEGPVSPLDESAASYHAASHSVRVIDVGRLGYSAALAMQRELHAKVASGDEPPTVLLVEHDPVITISRRKSAPLHLLASRDQLAAMGIDIQETDRGGDITYHGPGQLVAYPIVRLAPLGVHIAGYMRLLEQAVIDAIAPFGVTGIRDACATGVWVALPALQSSATHPELPSIACASASSNSPPTAKLAALGVRLSRGVTLHGLALNVTTNLAHFSTIIPCGLPGRAVTSLAQLLGDKSPTMADVKSHLAAALARKLTPRGSEPPA